MRAMVIVLCAAIIGGCSANTQWTDINGQGRSNAAAREDSIACQREAQYPSQGSSRAEYELAAERFRNCMSQRGWKAAEP